MAIVVSSLTCTNQTILHSINSIRAILVADTSDNFDIILFRFVFEYVNTPISCINTTDVDDNEGSNSYCLKDIAKCSTLPYEIIPPSGLLGDENFNNTYVSRDTEASCHLVGPLILNKHIHPFGIGNPIYHCYMNSVIQLLFSILRIIITSLIPERKVPYPNFYLKQHIVHPVLQMWLHSNFDW